MKYTPMPELSYLKSILDYDPDTGVVTWKVTRNYRVKIGQVAGHLWTDKRNHKYYKIEINSKSYNLHRIAYYYQTGNDPGDMQIDHIDGNSLNNKFDNLRLATSSQNSINKKKQKNNKSGITGVYWHKQHKKWQAYIRINNKLINLGYYKYKFHAMLERARAERKYFGIWRRDNGLSFSEAALAIEPCQKPKPKPSKTNFISKNKIKHTPMPDLNYLKSILNYDPNTGVFTYKITRTNAKAGQVAGYLRTDKKNPDSKYYKIEINGKKYNLHRIAYYYQTGNDPGAMEIDHIDGNGSNNKFDNLRLATHANNCKNRKTKSIFAGVYWRKDYKKWQAYICVNYKQIHLGYYNSKFYAAVVRARAAKKYFGEWRRKNSS